MEPNPASPNNEPQEEHILDDALSMEGYDKPVRNARILLFIIAALQLIGIFLVKDLAEPEKTIGIFASIVVAVAFAGLAFWTKTKPYTAIIVALTLYIGLIIMNAVINPATIIQGIIIKAVVLVLLIVALKNARDVQRWKDAQQKSS